VKIVPFIKLATLIFAVNFILSAFALKFFRIFPLMQLFEQIMVSVILSAVCIGIAVLLLLKKSLIPSQRVPTIAWLILVAMLIMIILGPNTVMNVDRSRSFYVLSWVENNKIETTTNGELILNVESPEKFNIVSIKERLNEQSSRGLIEFRDNSYFLTWRGRLTFNMAETLAAFYKLDGWLKNRN
jgi:hypothetical protein